MQVDAMLLLQRQMEVEGLVRAPPKTPADLVAVAATFSELTKFVTRIGRIATRLGLPLELVFQCLLGLGAGNVDFDKQKRDGDVPMHQAKVLNRDAANSIAPQLRASVEAEELEQLVERSGRMRTFLRIKVEDANDLSQARRGLALAEEYCEQLRMLSEGDPERMWAIYKADDEPSIRRAIRGAPGAGADGAAAADGTGSDAEGSGPTTKPRPANLPGGVQAECTEALMTSTVAVPKRLRAIQNILAWLGETSRDELRAKFTQLVVALRGALKVQLAEKRSAITRGACDIVTQLMRAATPSVLNAAEVKETVGMWVSVMLKQVHVTVGAIAEATDATVRDVVLASHGATFVCTAVAHVLQGAAQPELQRKCVGYLVLALLTSSTDMASKVHVCVPVVDKMLRSGNEAIRRVARVFGLVLEQRHPQSSLPSWDDRCEKSAGDERATVREFAERGPAVFEVAVLRYEKPCAVAQDMPANDMDSPQHHAPRTPGNSTPTAGTPHALGHSRTNGASNTAHHPRDPHVPALTKRPQPAQVTREYEDSSPTQIPSHGAAPTQPRARHEVPGRATPHGASVRRPEPLNPGRLATPGSQPRPGSGLPLSLAGLTPNVHATPAGESKPADPLSSLRAKRAIHTPGTAARK
eukprot:CAMPEP_0174855072 /NCGR_PEP_ID=MMETSP1114-20130205/32393_1 /TAXON_ID=312471 /ORGANISM="Neobodo designis, Strain CCAP 1951/1" /LENGTH=640 /DNA_ID=CAMNT_0016089793 /DNA_START=56 /DNA_END=1978 /DNA_ORIENTATION=+